MVRPRARTSYIVGCHAKQSSRRGQSPNAFAPGHVLRGKQQRSRKLLKNMVARDGVEPPTPAFSGLDSTTITIYKINNLSFPTPRYFVRKTFARWNSPFSGYQHHRDWIRTK